MLAERTRALNAVTARALSLWWLLLLWVLAGVFAGGWSLLVTYGADTRPDTVSLLLVVLTLAPLLLPVLGAAIGLACALSHLLRLHHLLWAWHGLANVPVSEARWRRRALTWLVTCALLGGVALCAECVWLVGAEQGDETYVEAAAVIGGTTLAWLAGLAGVTHALVHLRWSSASGRRSPVPGAHTSRNVD